MSTFLDWVAWGLVWGFAAGFLVLFVFVSSLAVDAFLYRRWLRRQQGTWPYEPLVSEELPDVLVQLPIYNELDAVRGLLDSVAGMDYPKEKLDIQVLDDSDDETTAILARDVARLRAAGYRVEHVRRADRSGYKAGALQYGMGLSRAPLIAIFDADARPPRDFLTRLVPYFRDEQVGMVQTRWRFVNADKSFLLRLFAFAMNAHFTVGQGGRNYGGGTIIFNGTGGIWRRATIEDAGGWRFDSLTEDYDLSYRAQMKGWRFLYTEPPGCDSELPATLSAIRVQQYRWMKGGAENLRLHLLPMLRSTLPRRAKLLAFFHLTEAASLLAMAAVNVIGILLLLIPPGAEHLAFLRMVNAVFGVNLLLALYFYWAGYAPEARGKGLKAVALFPVRFVAFLVLFFGMLPYFTVAVIEGLLGRRSAFMRTPKINLEQAKRGTLAQLRDGMKVPPLTYLEGLGALLMWAVVFHSLFIGVVEILGLHLMLAAGMTGVVARDLWERLALRRIARQLQAAPAGE